jgi:uncharacterized protein YwqG
MNSEITELVRKLKQPTLICKLQSKRNNKPNLNSYIGGHPYSEKKDRVPYCRICKKEMEFIFQLNIPVNKGNNTIYSFYYCQNCKMENGRNGFKVLKYNAPDPNKIYKKKIRKSSIQYAEFLFQPQWSLPDWNSLPFIDSSIQQHFSSEYKEDAEFEYEQIKENILQTWSFDAYSFYGGYPNFIGFPEFPTCPHCNDKMELFIQLDSEIEKHMTWKDHGCLQLFKCKNDTDNYEILIQ